MAQGELDAALAAGAWSEVVDAATRELDSDDPRRHVSALAARARAQRELGDPLVALIDLLAARGIGRLRAVPVPAEVHKGLRELLHTQASDGREVPEHTWAWLERGVAVHPEVFLAEVLRTLFTLPAFQAHGHSRLTSLQLEVRYRGEAREAAVAPPCTAEVLDELEARLEITLPGWYRFLATRLFDGRRSDASDGPYFWNHRELRLWIESNPETWPWVDDVARARAHLAMPPAALATVTEAGEGSLVRSTRDRGALAGVLHLGGIIAPVEDYCLCVRGPHAGRLLVLTESAGFDHEDREPLDDDDALFFYTLCDDGLAQLEVLGAI